MRNGSCRRVQRAQCKFCQVIFFLLIYFPITLSNAPHTQPQFSFINIYSSRVVVPNCIIGAFCTTFCKPFGKHSHDASRSPLWRSNEGRTTCVRDRFYGTFIAGFCRTHVSRLSSCERAKSGDPLPPFPCCQSVGV